MKILTLFVLTISALACAQVATRAAQLDASPAYSLTPDATGKLTATSTPTPVPITPTPTLIPSQTPRADVAPTLPYIDVQFIYHGDREKPYVALTFDLCQIPGDPASFDRGIYEVLTRYDVPATFFMGGDWMRTHPDETMLLASNPKFDLGNHSWSHPDLPGMSDEEIGSEIVKTQDLLFALTGRQSSLFRLPSGRFDDQVLSVIARHGLYTIQWDVETGDPDPNIDSERLTGGVQATVQNGSIVIMHANGRGWHTAEALPEVIDYLHGQGYTLVTVSQLLGLERLPRAGS